MTAQWKMSTWHNFFLSVWCLMCTTFVRPLNLILLPSFIIIYYYNFFGCNSVRKRGMLRESITVMFILWFTHSENYFNHARGSCNGKGPTYNYFELWDIWHSYTTPTSEIWHGMGWRPTLRSRKQPAHLYHVAWQQPIQTIQDPSPQSGRKLLMCVSSEGRNQ